MGKLADAAAALGVLRSVPAPEEFPAVSVTPPPRLAAGGVEQAMTLESVYRAVQVLQTGASQLTLDVWRGGRRLDAVPSLLAKPDLNSSLSAFLAETVGALAQRGNAYWLHNLGPKRETVNLTVLPPLEVAPIRYEPGRPRRWAWRGREYGPDEMTHLQLMRTTGRAEGLGPLQAWRASVAGALAVRDYTASWMTGGGVPNGVLSTDMPLTAEDAAAYKAQWMASVKASEPAVLGRGLTYQYLALKPSEIQWIESRQLTPTEVARLFGIPASLMLTGVKGSSLTYSNLEMDTLQFVRWTLMAYLREVEEAFSACLPRGQRARFNLDAILRADTASRYAAYSTAISAGFLTPDEVRAEEGLAPLTNPTADQEAPADA